MPKSSPTHLYGSPDRLSFSSISSAYNITIFYLGLLGVLRVIQEGSLLDVLGLGMIIMALLMYYWTRK